VKDFVEYIVKNIFDAPEKVVVSEYEQNGETTVSLDVDKQDLGKVIGYHGKTVSALRVIFRIYAKKMNKNIRFVLAEDEKRFSSGNQSSSTL